ncbi:MAG: folylpolyglutamate synthase/dihydrofolate synthase family protein [Dissulfurispiraceae bacterium]|jgi:dihydrofolate synthase/folylpolyglutamate synthase|nr:folylpolyglutamate synthase/dihydrofolate synthase family protein [Dissulfurispiraceae bacterium]
MNYNESISFLYGLQKHGIKLGLERIRKILDTLGNPHQQFSSIHIAGTNGKGSTAAACECILRSHGLKTGLFTSPHLISFTERIRINGIEITETDVIRLTSYIRAETDNICQKHGQPTFFEFVTAMAFCYFAEQGIDWAVVETGMGGRLDATNVLIPAVSVITPVSLDHREFLGSTLKEIASEKAGIIKQGVPVVSALQKKEAADLLLSTAKRAGSEAYFYDVDFSVSNIKTDALGSTFDYTDGDIFINNIHLPLPGRYQTQNSAAAVKAALLALGNNRLSLENTAAGLNRIKWPGRLEMISDNPAFLLDAAHNPDAANALAEYLKSNYADRSIIFIIGMMADKDITQTIMQLLPLSSKTIFTRPPTERAASAQSLSDAALDLGYENTCTTDTIQAAIDLAYAISAELSVTEKPDPLIVATGSFYTIGEIKAALGAKRILHDLTEKF